MAVLWNSAFEATPAGTDAGSTIDDKIQEFKVMVRKFLATILTDTSDTAIGSGADEDAPQVKDECIDSDAYVDASIDTAHLNAGQGIVDNSGAIDIDGIVEKGSSADELNVKVIATGTWNMDTTANKSVAHGLTAADIRSVSVSLKDTAGTSWNMLRPTRYGGDEVSATVGWDATNILMSRIANADYDNSSWNAASGFITIWYKV